MNSRGNADNREKPEQLLSETVFRDCADRVTALLTEYLRESRSASVPVIRTRPIAEITAELGLTEWIERGGMTPTTFESFLRTYLDGTTRLHHPAYIAHQVATPLLPSTLAEFASAVVNNPMAIFEMGPPAVAIELAVIEWMARKVGWETPPAGGVLTHGGSLANLTALVAAREAGLPGSGQRGVSEPLAILATPAAHYSVRRAAALLGLGVESLCPVRTDERGVLEPDALPEAFERAVQEGRRPFAVVALACATVTGLHDPIEPIARFCEERDLWLHVDAAHGASALLSETERRHLRGIERADSIIWDAHKMLGTPALCAAVLLRDTAKLEAAFREDVPYLVSRDSTRRPEEGIDLLHRTVECTKAAMGLKLFLNLAFFGEAGLARHVESLYAAARTFHDQIRRREGFESPVEPESNIVLFRYVGDDDLQREIRRRLLARGEFYLSAAVLRDRPYLRLSVMNPATSADTIAALLDAIERAAGEAAAAANATGGNV